MFRHMWQDAVEELEGTINTLQLDYKNMAGQITSRSTRLWGEVARQRVRVLIDMGASYNFICSKLVECTGLPRVSTAGFVVKVGSGTRIEGMGRCEGVQV